MKRTFKIDLVFDTFTVEVSDDASEAEVKAAILAELDGDDFDVLPVEDAEEEEESGR